MSKRNTKTTKTTKAQNAEQVVPEAPTAPTAAPLVLVSPPSLEELEAEQRAAKEYLTNLRARTAEIRAKIKDEKRAAREAKRAAKGLGPQTGPVAQARAELRAAIAAGVVDCTFPRDADGRTTLALRNEEIDALVASVLASIEKAKTAKRAAAKARKQAKAAA